MKSGEDAFEDCSVCRFIAIMAPAAAKLQRLLNMPRFQTPKSDHDANFHSHFYSKLVAAVTMLQSPHDAVLKEPEQAASLLKSLTHSAGRFCRCFASLSSCSRRIYLTGSAWKNFRQAMSYILPYTCFWHSLTLLSLPEDVVQSELAYLDLHRRQEDQVDSATMLWYDAKPACAVSVRCHFL